MSENITLVNNDLFVMGEIGYDFRAEDFIHQLNNLPDKKGNIHIYSGGGSLFDALAVYDYVNLKGLDLTFYISGLSGSAATIIGASGKTFIGANSFYFVHSATSSSKELEDKANERLVSIYKKLTGLNKATIKELLIKGDNGSFLTASEAVKLGFVNEIFKEDSLAAHKPFDLVNYNNQINNNKMNEETKGLIADLKNFITEKFTTKPATVENTVDPVNEVKIMDDEEVKRKFTDIENSYSVGLEAKDKEIQTLKDEVAKLTAAPTNQEVTEPVITDDVKKSDWEVAAEQVQNSLPKFN